MKTKYSFWSASVLCAFLTAVNPAFAQTWTNWEVTSAPPSVGVVTGGLGWSMASSADGVKLAAAALVENQVSSAPMGIYTSENSGRTWTLAGPTSNTYFSQITSSEDGTKLVALSDDNLYTIWTSSDSGQNWSQAPSPTFLVYEIFPDGYSFLAYTNSILWESATISGNGDNLVAWGTAVVAVYVYYDPYMDYQSVITNVIYSSVDLGTTWQQISTPPSNASPSLITSSADGTRLALTGYSSDTNDGAIFTSTDSGETWTEHDIPDFVADGYVWTSIVLSANGATLLATADFGPFYISTNSGATWGTVEVSPASATITSVASSADGTKLVAASFDETNGLVYSVIYSSSDSGTSWIPVFQNGDFYSSVASSSDGTKLIAGGRLIYTQNTEPSLLTLANLCNNIYSGDSGYADFQFVANNATLLPETSSTVGFLANVYTNSDQTVVVVFRGTFPQGSGATLYFNILADWGFTRDIPTQTLKDYVNAALGVVAIVQSLYPNANIFLTGHSLGGALAQLVGQSQGLTAAGFNAPGSGQLYEALFNQVLGSAVSSNINYRLDGDQVSEVGTQIGSTITISEPSYLALDVNPFFSDLLSEVLGGGNWGRILQLHYMNTVIAQIADNAQQVMDLAGPNVCQALETSIESVSSSSPNQGTYLYTFDPEVTNTMGYLINPQQTNEGTDYFFSGEAGSPNIAAIDLPTFDGVASYVLRSEAASVWSGFQLVEPGVPFYFGGSGVSSFEFIPLDTNANPAVVTGLVFGLYFTSSGDFSGSLTQSFTVPAFPPILQIAQVGNQVNLSWTTNDAASFVLVTTTNLIVPINWNAVTNNPLIVSNQFVVTVPTIKQMQLFRLQQ